MYEVQKKHLFESVITGPTTCLVRGIKANTTAIKLAKYLNATYDYAFKVTNRKIVGAEVYPDRCDSATMPLTTDDDSKQGWHWDLQHIEALTHMDVFGLEETSDYIQLDKHKQALTAAFIKGATDGDSHKKKEMLDVAEQGMQALLPSIQAKFGNNVTYYANHENHTIELSLKLGESTEELIGDILEISGGIKFTAKNAPKPPAFKGTSLNAESLGEMIPLSIIVPIPVTKESPQWLTKQGSLYATRLHVQTNNAADLLFPVVDSYARKQGKRLVATNVLLLKELCCTIPEDILPAIEPHQESFEARFGKGSWTDFKEEVTTRRVGKNSLTQDEASDIELF